MHEIRPRDIVVLAEDFDAQVRWYCETLGFVVRKRIDDGFHWCDLETPTGLRLGIASAQEMGVQPKDRENNSVVMQIEVDDLRAFFEHVKGAGGAITGGPSHSPDGDFWFGQFADPEGNPCWVVDKNCP